MSTNPVTHEALIQFEGGMTYVEVCLHPDATEDEVYDAAIEELRRQLGYAKIMEWRVV